jgi:hypothetical protein
VAALRLKFHNFTIAWLPGANQPCLRVAFHSNFLAGQFWIDARVAMRTGAAGDRTKGQAVELQWVNPGQSSRLLKHIDHTRVIKDIAPIALRADQPGFAHDHQVLRDACLAHLQNDFQMANTGCLGTDDPYYLDARRLADQRKQFRDPIFRVF